METISLRKRQRNAHKGTEGHAFLIAGKVGMAGAALLASRACMRSGVGKLTVRTQESNRIILQLGIPEAILDIQGDSCNCFSDNLGIYQAVAVGPGMGCGITTFGILKHLMRKYRKPIVFDADAINVISENRDLVADIPPCSILTPHKLELRRLIGQSVSDDEELAKTISFAKENGVVVVMKGAPTKVVAPDGGVHVNTTGNPGMATAGSGDVLTGIILGLMTQGYAPLDAAKLGVYIHGLAGDIAAESFSEEAMIASDIVNAIPKAFLRLHGE